MLRRMIPMVKSLLIPSRAFSWSHPHPQKLREIMKMSLIEKETPSGIKEIWSKYHEDKPDSCTMVVDKANYTAFSKNLKLAPSFIIPVKRKGGHFLLYSQAQDNTIIYTFLDEYKKNGMLAEPYFVCTFYEELLEMKGLVLVRGTPMEERLTPPEAKMVLGLTVSFYMTPELFNDHVYTFNKDTSNFEYDAYARAMNIDPN